MIYKTASGSRFSMNELIKIPKFNNLFATKCGSVLEFDGVKYKEAYQYQNTDGYYQLVLKVSGKRRILSKHRVLCAAFNGAPPSKQSVARHLNDNKTDNSIGNLRWGSSSDNHIDARNNWSSKNRTGHWNSKFSDTDVLDIKMLLSFGAKGTSIAQAYGVTRQAIYRIKNGWVWNNFSCSGNNKHN